MPKALNTPQLLNISTTVYVQIAHGIWYHLNYTDTVDRWF